MSKNTETTIKDKKDIVNDFFKIIRRAGESLSSADLDLAIETLKFAGLEIKEREDHARRLEEARIAKEKQEKEEKRRQAAAARAAKRAAKEHAEHVEKVTAMDLPMDWVNAFDLDSRTKEHVESVSDGLMMSLDALGMVDIEFISSVTGLDYKTVIEKLKGSIYQNPLFWNECFYKGWETADEYLSGNLGHKLNVAKQANEEYNGYFKANVDALEALIEPEIDEKDIYVTLGSPWVPSDIIDDFILHLIGEDPINGYYSNDIRQFFSPEYAVRHDEITGMWEIPNKTRFRKGNLHGLYEEVNYSTYGTERMDMLYLLENILNMKTLSVTDARDDIGKVRVINNVETVKLLEKQDKMIQEFKDWVWKDENRKNRLKGAYGRKYGNIRRRKFDGSFLEFPDMSKSIELYPYQKDAVARILFSPNTLLAHDVGAGKTYVMIAAGMELRRLEKSKKNLYVVPNNIIGQWQDIFHEMYPEAKLLIVDNKNFNSKKRSETLKRIVEEDFDAIIMTYSCFDMISLSRKYYEDLYELQLKRLKKASGIFYQTGKIDRKIKTVQTTLEKLHKDAVKGICDIPFDDLGINTLFVDEAHNYKNVSVDSSISRVLGAGFRGSEKCDGMMDKVHCVQRQNNGGRVIFATGTPITNSITDIFVMQKYLQDGELEFLGVQNFDSWAGMYAEKRTDFEIDVDTNSYHLATRFSRFCNIPELTSVLSSIADFHHVDKQAGLPEFSGYDDSLRDGSADFKEYLMDISNRADDIRQKRVGRLEDNLLKITSDGRKAALDMRLIDEAYGLDPDSKVLRCAENVMEVYENTRDINGVQLVFCDISTPKESFNLYDELKALLCAMGMPKDQIAFIHDADSDNERNRLFEQLREGKKSVLVGSTFKMGLGMNVQDRLAALHHLDVPWRPADMVQREGRILRQGNTCSSVKIFRYITRGSFDAYSWQLLETKQRFISQLLSGHTTVREGSDVDEAVLNYSEVKALAVGNPLIKRRVEVSNELDKYRILHRDYIEERKRKTRELRELPDRIKNQEKRIENCKLDIKACEEDTTDYDDMPYLKQKELRETIYTAVSNMVNRPFDTKITTYRGFTIVVPAYMVPKRVMSRKKGGDEDSKTAMRSKSIPYVHLRMNGSYYLEIESESGITKRLNNFCGKRNIIHKDKSTGEESIEILPSGLEMELNQYKDELAAMNVRKTVLEKELKQTGGFDKEIDELTRELSEIDAEMGIIR